MRLISVSSLVLGAGFVALGAVSNQPQAKVDPIAKLVQDMEAGNSSPTFEAKHGYLKGLLKRLEIPVSSQTLVWSKTSLQGPKISPRNPRAIYFNDHTYVGWVNGGEFIEIGTVHPTEGTQFYTIRNEKQLKFAFEKEFDRCIACHAGPGMGGSPRLLSRSVNADPQGYQILRGGGRIMTPRTPIRERWGGWYVSGTHGKLRHRGNSPAIGDDDGFTFNEEVGANKTDLGRYFDTSQYLSPHSDIAALMVLEHQMHVQNEIIRAGAATRKWLLDPSTTLHQACEPLVEALLGLGEVELAEPIQGMGTFQSDYESKGIKDKKGRSLRELDLRTRLYKYRLSPMILSESFASLPGPAKKQTLSRIKDVLTGKDASGRFSFVAESERTVLLEMLAEFKLLP